MRMVPTVVLETQSSAEDRLFARLAALEWPGWTALHSLNLSEHHDFKQWSELDFVLVGPPGVFVLEVKGGGVRCKDGVWSGVNRHGCVHQKRESPFDQARGAMYALKRTLDAEMPSVTAKMVFGWGVVFPDVDFATESPELPREVICDRRDSASSETVGRYLRGLTRYWGAKASSLAEPGSPQVIADVVRFLRPNFDLYPKLSCRAETTQRELVAFTSEQYEKLDAIEESDRIICTGGAGTGKSFLALQAARREAAAGRQVLLVVAGELFAVFLAAQSLPASVAVMTFADLQKHVAEGDFHPVQTLIVDEGQDLLNLDAMVVLGQAVAGGLEKGRWRWFMDPNNQSGIEGRSDPEAASLLRSLGAVPLRLKRNCRNTPEIVLQTQLTTGADIGEAEARGAGAAPVYKAVASREEAARALELQLDRWASEEIRPDDIAILSPRPLAESIAALLPLKWARQLVTIDPQSVASPVPGKVLFATVREFKGLERAFVCVVDVDDPAILGPQLPTMYVGMTRANFGLWIAMSPACKRAMEAAHIANVHTMLERSRP